MSAGPGQGWRQLQLVGRLAVGWRATSLACLASAQPPTITNSPVLAPFPLPAAGLQTVHEVMRKRGQRTTFQNMRQAVEEASGRRFLVRGDGERGLPGALALDATDEAGGSLHAAPSMSAVVPTNRA